ncbi:DeoR/GlpR family DNA-binding transcription regulator [Pendulispora brunnea]|uniref:DeoR/GlpR family DNA-binding transcription regulator n=1 Tax=Pendulispora brunnea TaxID=2905690 RepID=A0ABZ2KIW7_9BACT
MLVEERRRKILQMLDEQGSVMVEELSERFSVSTVTIRADLASLERTGRLVRSHGGAVKPQVYDMPLGVKETLHRREKGRIGQAAAKMIRDGETVLLDSGTSTAAIAREVKALPLRALTVITNALNIAMELAGLRHIRVIMLGGMLREMSYSLVGPHAEQILERFHVDRLFLGVDGVDPEVGLTTPDVLEAKLNALMIRVSRQVVVVADSSKFGRRSLSKIADLDAVHKVITDRKISADMVRALKAANIEVVIV